MTLGKWAAVGRGGANGATGWRVPPSIRCCPPGGFTPARDRFAELTLDQGQLDLESTLAVRIMGTDARGRLWEHRVSPGAALGPGRRSDNQVRFHGRCWLLGLAEA